MLYIYHVSNCTLCFTLTTATTLSFVDRFAKLSLLQRAINFQQNPCQFTHHTLSRFLHYLGKCKNQKFCTFAHVIRISNVTFYHLYNRYLSNIMKIRANISTAKYQHFTFCSFTVLSKLTVLQLSNVGLSTIQHQHSKISHHKQKTLEPKHIKMPIVCISLLKKCSKCPPFARKHALRRFLHWSIAISIMSCPKSDHNASTNVRYSLLDHK